MFIQKQKKTGEKSGSFSRFALPLLSWVIGTAIALHFLPFLSAVLIAVLAVLTARIMTTDLREMLIYQKDVGSIFALGAVAAIMGALFVPSWPFAPVWWGSGLAALLRAFLTAGILLFVAWIYQSVRHRPGLGHGDVLLSAAWATLLPLDSVLHAVTFAAIGVIAVLLVLKRRLDQADKVPFGAALAPAFWLVFVLNRYFALH